MASLRKRNLRKRAKGGCMSEPYRFLKQDYSRKCKCKGLGSKMFLVFKTEASSVESAIKRKRRKEFREVMEASLCMSHKTL